MMELKTYLFQVLKINNRLHSYFLNSAYNALKLIFLNHGYILIKNSNIQLDTLWQEGLHLSNSGKGKILNDFIVS